MTSFNLILISILNAFMHIVYTYLICILLCIILKDIIVNCKINIQGMGNKSCIKDKILYNYVQG